MLCSMFPDVPCLAMTATATKVDMKAIQDSLGLKQCWCIVGNPDRKNIFYKKIFREGRDIDAMKSILVPLAECLLKEKNAYPLTIIYVPLRLCGFAYKLFEFVLGTKQYFPPGSAAIPKNRLFAQFHAPQTAEMKQEILEQLCSGCSVIRVVFATIAIGMGVDIPNIRQIIHLTPPHSVKAYFQETGRAGRDGMQSTACLFYNNKDIATNRPGIEDSMRSYCSNKDLCLRSLLLKALDFEQDVCLKPLHWCCDICERQCDCADCLNKLMEKL